MFLLLSYIMNVYCVRLRYHKIHTYIHIYIYIFIYIYCGAKGLDHILGLGPQPRVEQSEDEWMVMNVSIPGPNECSTYGRMV